MRAFIKVIAWIWIVWNVLTAFYILLTGIGEPNPKTLLEFLSAVVLASPAILALALVRRSDKSTSKNGTVNSSKRTCRVCSNSMPAYLAFCTRCGGRQRVFRSNTTGTVKRGFVAMAFGRLTYFFKDKFRSQDAKYFDAICNLAQYSAEAPIRDLEILYNTVSNERLKTEINKMLAMFYVMAGRERSIALIPRSIDGWWGLLRSVRSHQLSGDRLDDELENVLQMFSEARRRGSPEGDFAAAHFYKTLADRALIWSEVPGFDFGDEIAWLYQQAKDRYDLAIRLDATYTTAYIELSQVLTSLGRTAEAKNNLQEAVVILNRAIQADTKDERSYSERAIVFEELGFINQALSDLRQLLTLTTREYELDSVRNKIDVLIKRQDETSHA